MLVFSKIKLKIFNVPGGPITGVNDIIKFKGGET